MREMQKLFNRIRDRGFLVDPKRDGQQQPSGGGGGGRDAMPGALKKRTLEERERFMMPVQTQNNA